MLEGKSSFGGLRFVGENIRGVCMPGSGSTSCQDVEPKIVAQDALRFVGNLPDDLSGQKFF